ncbi:hypothetical protein [Mucilaginibacter sp. OK268]|uniref:hypothetical protein n=1 Tax=Mucilaginibacter sp. OK268 TaxID=1881048 RepID=UPI00115FACBD|nr:hypothetical protein [Mucilaginibacter sp. OK268]
MMTKKTKVNNSEKVKYEELFFYTIPLCNNDLLLHKEVLYKHFPAYKKINKEKVKLNSVFVDYHTGVFTLALQKDEMRFQQIYFRVEMGTLHVACDCGMPGQVLCEHAYRALSNIIHRKLGRLEPYYWPGFEPDAEGISKYLDIRFTQQDAYIKPSFDFGNLFKRGLGFKKQDDVSFEQKLPEPAFKKEGVHDVLGYQLLYNSHSFYRNHLPFLIPFIGTTTKSGDGISYYKTYLKNVKQFKHGLNLSKEQIILNEISYAMFEIATSIPFNKVKGEYSPATKEYMPLMLNLWRKAIPKLRFEQHIKSSYSYNLNTLPSRPKKTDLKVSQITMSELDISFVLSDNGDYYQLVPIIKANGKDISEHYFKVSLFIIEPITSSHYHFHLIGNLQDEYLLNWLDENQRRLTVLKQDFESFYDGFLKKLSECYQVMFRRYKGSKLQPYRYERCR